MLDSINKRIQEKAINNSIFYEPKQGDLVLIRAHIKCFRDRIELNAISCNRLENSNDEIIQMIIPSVLNERIYSLKAYSKSSFNNLNAPNREEKSLIENSNKTNDSLMIKETFLAVVNKKLIEITSKSADYTLNNQSCSSYSLFTILKNSCNVEYKFITPKLVLDALKELELRGVIYSCEDESHYLPIN